MKKILIVTTFSDLSVPFFLAQSVRKDVAVDIVFYNDGWTLLQAYLAQRQYDSVYLRDPFNDKVDQSESKEIVRGIGTMFPESYFVDHVRDFDDILCEDKWRQFQEYGAFMPKTEILRNPHDIAVGRTIAKKRLSSRARGIVMTAADFPREDSVDDYVLQECIAVDREFRVYVICGDIMPTVSIKSPKTATQKVAVVGHEKISPDLMAYVQKLVVQIPYDFVGLDIVQRGAVFYLLEVNRSCLFNGYFAQTGVNLAHVFVEKMIKKALMPN